MKITIFKKQKKKGLSKFDQEIYDIFMDSFEYLPIAYLINGKFLGLHGGISPELKTVFFLFIKMLEYNIYI